jgi:taurine dioxygenase
MLRRHHNPQVQHKATFDYDLPQRRLMRRTTVRGTAPFQDPHTR